MQKKKLKKTDKFLEIESKGITFTPINRNGWWVKLSMVQHNILLIFVSDYTGQTIIRFYDNEKKAVEFINFIINSSPTIELDFEGEDEQ
jgi:hypothetical protein